MKDEKVVQQFRDERSMELFNKLECELGLNERMTLEEYIDDYNNPEWRPIIFDMKKSKYFISTLGKVLSIKRGKAKLLKQSFTKDGYYQVKLYIGDKKISCRVHRLVAEAFIPNPENKPQVNHINGKKDFNWVGNLEWMTCKENVQHAFRTGLNHGRRGSMNHNCKYSEDQVHEICKLLENGKEAKEISLLLNISKYAIGNIKSRSSWIHISNNYNIPSPKPKVKRATGTRENIINLLNNGIYDYGKILKSLNLPVTLKNRMYVSGIKCELKRLKEETSTTIDQH